VVDIRAGGVTLSGFTITGAAGSGVHVGGNAAEVKIVDNIALGNRLAGFRVEVIDVSPPPIPVPVSQYTLRGNLATGNSVGFTVEHDETHTIPERVFMAGNTASANTKVGFSLRGQGFQLQLIENVASNNGTGVDIEGNSYHIRNNSVLGNAGPGLLINGRLAGSDLQITGNTIVGNIGAGILILPDATNNVIRGNNIWGNFGAGPVPTVPSIVSTLNCGIANAGFDQLRPVTTDATNNYWGSPAGPGPDPADNAGKGCDFNQGTTVVKPFATIAFGISP
jgi:hypothetical protein